MKKGQILWGVISVIIFTVLLYFISLENYFFNPYLTTFVTGIACAITALFSLTNITSTYDVGELLTQSKNQDKDASDFGKMLLAILYGLIMGVLFFTIQQKRVDSEFETNGIIASAKVLNGTHIANSIHRGVKNNTFTLQVSFHETLSQRDINTQVEVPQEVFESVYKDQTIEIIYSKTNPNMLKPIILESDIKRFKKIENRLITFQDLEILSNNDIDKNNLLEYLLSVSTGWSRIDDESDATFVAYHNPLKDENVAYSNIDHMLFYSGSNLEFLSQNEELVFKYEDLFKDSFPQSDLNPINLKIKETVKTYDYKHYLTRCAF
ncbi:hypothetical protein GJV76_14450 [Myroides sp. BIT-d1]|uniref:DUF3592 domain-containing protein n=2 Tax=Myroides TaxID=76831 RepID=A0A6I3LNJ0_9FLAO|nr:hypothetical protein [Myroides albus]MTG99307.1 hypothetical protein [Myroides albus]